MTSPARYVVIDFEAARDCAGRLAPVEFGYAIPGGKSDARFIRPPSGWFETGAEFCWGGHITSEQVLREGADAGELAAWIQRNLKTRIVVSDAAFVDQPLMDRLLDRSPSAVKIEIVEFFPLLGKLAGERHIRPEIVNAWICDIDAGRSAAHRAEEDARVRAELLHRVLTSAGLQAHAIGA